MKFRPILILLGIVLPGMAYTQSEPPEVVITKAAIKNGKVYVKGHGGIPGEPVRWIVRGTFNDRMPVLDTVDDSGHFSFVSDELPTLPRCFAEVVVGDILQEITIAVDNCKGTVIGFYSVSNNPEAEPDQMVWIAPGDRGGVSVACRPGDAAVSSDYYITTNTNTRANASVVSDSLTIDYLTHVQSRGVTIVNHGDVDTELRVQAMCAEVKPPASRTPGRK